MTSRVVAEGKCFLSKELMTLRVERQHDSVQRVRKLKNLNIEQASFLPFTCDSTANRCAKSLAK